ncbi:hypothetical protein P8452_21763 [Trifolium repens]|nr:hypothetical protein P8452_21763 [Trifolium repens]
MVGGGIIKLKTWQQAAVALGSAVGALLDPRRADLIAALGETTGKPAFQRVLQRMKSSPEGRAVLLERPRVVYANVGHAWDLPENTFGAAYAKFMGSRNFSPDDRPPVRFMDTDELAYVAMRAREVHDFWHTLFDLPTNLMRESALKGARQDSAKSRENCFISTTLPGLFALAHSAPISCVYIMSSIFMKIWKMFTENKELFLFLFLLFDIKNSFSKRNAKRLGNYVQMVLVDIKSLILILCFISRLLWWLLRKFVGKRVSQEVAGCEVASGKIDEIISLDGEKDQKVNSFSGIPDEFFEDMESIWKGRTKTTHVDDVLTSLDKAAEALHLALLERIIICRMMMVKESFDIAAETAKIIRENLDWLIVMLKNPAADIEVRTTVARHYGTS